MSRGGGEFGNITVAQVIALMSDAAASLFDKTLDTDSDEQLIESMREWETIKRRMSSFEHRMVGEAKNRCLPEKVGLRADDVTKFLEQTLRLSHADARARFNASQLLGVRQVAGQVLEPQLAWTAAVQEQGLISADHARVIGKIMARIPEAVDPVLRDEAEYRLAHLATESTPDVLPKAGDMILGYLDPDGALVRETDRRRRRGITLGKPGVDGMTEGTFSLTPQARALIDPIFAALGRPGMCNPEDPESPWSTQDLEPEKLQDAARRDTRSTAQRNHDALVAFLRPELGPAHGRSHRGLPVSTIITMSLADLEAAAGVATTASGGTVPMEEALQLAEHSKPFLAIFDHHGRPLHLGQSKRMASTHQRLALIAAERGCSRPGCNAPATVSAVHHVTDWAKGGPTDIENLTLACDACHSMIGEGPKKWKTVAMPPNSPHPGRIGWIPPHHVDPTQTPRVNHLHHAGELLSASLTKSRNHSRPPVKWWSRP